MSNPQPASTLARSDRSTTLLVFGFFEVLLGCLCGLFALFVVAFNFGGRVGNGPQGFGLSRQVILQSLAVYLLLAVAFIWVGFGLIRARQWAWTLTVLFSWLWLLFGVVTFTLIAGAMASSTWPATTEQWHVPPETMKGIHLFTGALTACIYILLPGIFLTFCQKKPVRATCELQDPQIPWTDRCPMPVLAVSLTCALSAVSLVSSVIGLRSAMPVFGLFVSGVIGVVAILSIALLLAYLAWGTYRLRPAAWWGTLLIAILGTVNTMISYRPANLTQMYEKMGFTAEQVELIGKTGIVESFSRWGPWLSLATGAACFAYVLYIRRYFVRPVDASHASAAGV